MSTAGSRSKCVHPGRAPKQQTPRLAAQISAAGGIASALLGGSSVVLLTLSADNSLRILHLEDDADYGLLVRDLLRRDGFVSEIIQVPDRAGYESALAGGTFDVILADFSLPDYSGLKALAEAQRLAPHTPFILVTGTMGEQAAVESLRAGATDYVFKQGTERLLPAIQRAVAEAGERQRRRAAEAELAAREKYFRALTDNALDVVTLLDVTGAFLYSSPSVRMTRGYTPEELTGQSAFSRIHPDDLPEVLKAFQFSLAHPEQVLTLTFRFRHQNGSWIHLESVGQNRISDPDIAALVINSRDLTERKRIERRSNVLSALGRSLSSVSCPREAAEVIRDAVDQLFVWDAFTLDLYNEPRDEMRAILNMDTIGGRHVVVETSGGRHKASGLSRRIMEHGAELIRVPEPVQMLADAHAFGDTSRPSACLLFEPIRGRQNVVGLLSIQSYTPDLYAERDLGTLQTLADHCGGALERINAAGALCEREQRFRDLFVNSPDGIFVEDLNGNVLDVNPAACQLQGLARDQIVGRNVCELVPDEQRDEARRDFRRLVEGSASRAEGASVAADGRVTPVEIRATRIQQGGKDALLLHVRDLSDRKQAESALRSSEMLFHSVWENSVDGMRLTDERGVIVAVNEAFCRLVGLKRAELEGRPFTVIYADSEQPERILKKYQQHFQERVIECQIERHLTLRNGTSVVLEDANSFVELRGQPPLLLGLFRDVTAQKKLEDQLRQSQKMDAIGQLAGGVAHDFNNILTVIHGHASLLLAGGNLTAVGGRSAQQIVQATDRAAGLTQQLLTFSRRQVMQPRRLDLNEVVANMNRRLGRILGEDIALHMTYWPKPPIVSADASMMEQVLLNFAVNARDAMPRGGQLSVRIAVEDLALPHTARHAEARAGRFVCLTASDTGCGIPPEILRRVFEPFFTTKEVGKGTGLGLATVYGIVKQHLGWVEVESELGRGANFRVYLPEAANAPQEPEDRDNEPTLRRGSETILVVEDEKPVRELMCSFLQAQGYKILEAESGVGALEVWRQHREQIALLLTDVVMPDCINGRELAETIWAERPNLKVIFTSGYTADVVGKDWAMRRGFNYVQKPYQPRKLASAVRECLDGTDMTPAI